LGIFGFRSRKKDDRESPRDDALEAAVAAAKIDAQTDDDEPGDAKAKLAVTAEQRAAFEERLLEHGLAGALLKALAFAKRRTGSLLEARWYVNRAPRAHVGDLLVGPEEGARAAGLSLRRRA
jgi:hypothetical protein